jgi:hypothetical protein
MLMNEKVLTKRLSVGNGFEHSNYPFKLISKTRRLLLNH